MTDSSIEKELLEQLHKLPLDQQKQVLNYARKLNNSRLKGISGREFSKYSYDFDINDLEEMQKVIKEGCEKVDINEW